MTRKELPSPELLRKLLRYEPDTGKLFWRERTPDIHGNANTVLSWNARFYGREITRIDKRGYACVGIMGRTFFAHRVIWAMHWGGWPRNEIDHINGDKRDNRIKNLRDVGRLLNGKNVAMTKRNTSGYVGVCWHKESKKWMAQIRIDGNQKYLGLFEDIDDAVRARKAAEIGAGFTKRHGKP